MPTIRWPPAVAVGVVIVVEKVPRLVAVKVLSRVPLEPVESQ